MGTAMQSWVWKPLSENELVFGYADSGRGQSPPQISGMADPIVSLQKLFNREVAPANNRGVTLTDDTAPVELMMDRGIVQALTGTGAASAPAALLPTAP